MRLLRIILMGAVVCSARMNAHSAVHESEGWKLDASVFEWVDGIATATEGITVRYGGATLTARRATVNLDTGEVLAEGEVRLVQEGRQWAGEQLTYNFKTGETIGEGYRGGVPPYFTGGAVLAGDREAGVYVGGNAYVTTDDYAEPGYRVKARTMTIVPGEYIEVEGATLYYGRVPVFYFPKYRRSLAGHPNNWVLVPGYRSRYGAYLLSSYNWYWNERLEGTLHLDARSKRGGALGPDFFWHLPRFGEGRFRGYYAHDEDPSEDFQGQRVDADRGRVEFAHSLPLGSNWLARGLVRYQSDATVLRDFFESEYKDNIQPSTFAEIERSFPNLSLNLYAQPRINPFFETVERLPDLKLTGWRQQIGATPFYYENESTVGFYRRRFEPGSGSDPFEAFRADTFHQVLLPYTAFGWLNVTPRAGGRFTHYSEAHGAGGSTEEENRAVFNTGVEVSTKASRVWAGARNSFWEIDGLRHIIVPSVNYGFVPRPNARPGDLPAFDYEVPTTRLLPITFPDYNAIDSIDSQNVIRLGVRNKLQTRRQEQIENVVNWALFMDWRLTPESGQRTFSDIYSDLDYQPFSWLTVSSETRYDINEKRWNEANHRLIYTPNNRWSLGVSHRYLRNVPGQDTDSGHNLISPTIFARLNENWGVRMSQHFEARDGVLEEQQYSLYRDFRSWTGALTFRVRDDRDGPTDYAVAVTFSLKAVPRFGRGDDSLKPSLLLGR